MIGYFVEVDKKKNPKKYEHKDSNKVQNPLEDVKPGMTLGDAMENNKKPVDNSSKHETFMVDEPK